MFLCDFEGMRCKARFKRFGGEQNKPNRAAVPQEEIALDDAIRIKSAEFWLKLGQPDQALLEIKSLPERLRNHPWVLKAHLAVVRASQNSNELSAKP